jgi:hypothetical protein
MSNQWEYNNRLGKGTRSSTTPSPRSIVEDFEKSIHRLSPDAFPFQSLKTIFGSGPAPTGFKVTTTQLHDYDHFDSCASATMGTIGNNETRYARFAPLQISRPETNGQVLAYDVQDILHIVETGQTVEVVVTPGDAVTLKSGSSITLSTALTGNTTTRTNTGSIVVRNVEDAPLIAFTTGSDIINMGKTLYESQDKGTTSYYNDPIYDCNFLEHKEATLVFTEEQKNMIKTRWAQGDWDLQTESTVKRHKGNVERAFIWGERSFEGDRPRARRTMRGLFNAIQSNIAYYNPDSILDYEIFMRDAAVQQLFRYNGDRATNKKFLLCGDVFAANFSYAFKDYRREVTLNSPNATVSLNLSKYKILDKYELVVMPHSMLRTGTKLENWAFVIDPSVCQFRIRKDHKTETNFANPDERVIKFLIEWQGTMSWNLEQNLGLLRTV